MFPPANDLDSETNDLSVFDAFVEMNDDELIDEVRQLELERRRVEARLSAATAFINTRNSWASEGHSSTKGFLKAHLNVSGTGAFRLKRRASFLNRFPRVAELYFDGSLGTEQVDELARLAHHPRAKHSFDEFAEQLITAAIQFEWADFQRVVERFLLGADPDGADQARDAAVEHRDARVSKLGSELAGGVNGGDSVTADEVSQIFDSFVDDEFQADCEHRRQHGGELPRSPSQRRFDAFVAMCRAARASRDQGRTSDQADVCVNVVMDADTYHHILQEALGGTPTNQQQRILDELLSVRPDRYRCHTADGQPLPRADAIRAVLTGLVRRVIVDANDVTINQGRRSRCFNGNAAFAAQLLADRCRFVGCDLPAAKCEIDHRQPWARGGRTDQHNADPLCDHNNQHKEPLGYSIETDIFGKPRTRRRDGSLILAVGMPEPPIPKRPPPTEPISSQEEHQVAEAIKRRLAELLADNAAAA